MSEPKPQYTGGRAAVDWPATHESSRIFSLPAHDEEAHRAVAWGDAVVEAVKGLARRGVFAPGDALRLERLDWTEDLTTGWASVTARVTVEPAAVAPPPCGCHTCRTPARTGADG